MDGWEKKEEMRTDAMFHFPWKSGPGMMSQTTFQLSIYEFGDIHDNNSRTCLVWILTTSGQTRGPSASFKHGGLRRNTNAEGSLLVFSAYFVVYTKYRRAKWKWNAAIKQGRTERGEKHTYINKSVYLVFKPWSNCAIVVMLSSSKPYRRSVQKKRQKWTKPPFICFF